MIDLSIVGSASLVLPPWPGRHCAQSLDILEDSARTIPRQRSVAARLRICPAPLYELGPPCEKSPQQRAAKRVFQM